MSSPSISASKIYKNERGRKDWLYRTHNSDLLNQDENKFDYKKSYLWKKKFSEIRKSEIYTKWENSRERKNNE